MTYFTQLTGRKTMSIFQIMTMVLAGFVLVVLQSSTVQAQWTTNGNNINNTNSGNVGVGTTAPDRKLSVNNTAAQSEEAISVYRPASANTSAGRSRVAIEFRGDAYSDNPNTYGWSLSSPNSVMAKITATPKSYTELGSAIAGIHASLGFSVQSAGHGGFLERMTILGNGNVGIGTASPAVQLHLINSSTAQGRIESTGAAAAALDFKNTSRRWVVGTGTLAGGGDFSIFDGNVSLTRMFFDTAGNVGIGTTTPGAKLDVSGSTFLQYVTLSDATSYGAISFRETGGSSKGHIGMTGSGSGSTYVGGANAFQIWNGQNTPMVFGTNGSERVRIDASGSVGIGTTAPTSKLHVVGDGNVTGNLIVGGNIAAKYQDVAEWVQSSQQLAAGTVVVLDHTRSNQVIASSQAYDTRVAGVISLQPGITLGENGAGKVLVATTGRVKVKVDASSGPIQVGDLLVTSDKEGVAKKSEPLNLGGVQIHRPGTLIGKALEPLAKGTGEILVLLSLQ